jgi:hypothetical protein
MFTDISEKIIASVFRVEDQAEQAMSMERIS